MKIGILLFGISILLWNCKKEQASLNDANNILEHLQNNFNFKDFKKTLPYEYVVDWNNPQKHYSEELKLSYYEFPINYITSFNPNNLNKQKGEGSYFIKFKIIATENNDNEYNYYAVKFYQDIDLSDNELINSDVSFSYTEDFSGTINLFNNGGELVFAKKLKNGCLKDGKVYYYNEFASSLKTVSADCYTITVHHYTDWYKYYPDLDIYIWDGISYEGSTSETICEDSGGYPPLPENFLEVGAGSGTYSVTTDSTIVEIEEEMEEFVDKPCPGNPVLNPEIAPSNNSGKEGGTFGCTRTNKTTSCGGVYGKKEHDGLDIKADINSNLFAIYGGVVSSIRDTFSPGQQKKGSFGNFVVITTVINGNTIHIKYNHLNSVSVSQGQHIIAGDDIIGLSGNTGNAGGEGIPPHVHIQVFNSDWTQKFNPEDYLLTKFDSNYNPISNNCNN